MAKVFINGNESFITNMLGLFIDKKNLSFETYHNKRWRIPRGQSKMDNQEKLAT